MKRKCIPLFLLCFLCSWMILPLEVSTSTKLLMPAMRVPLSISSWWMFTLRCGYHRNTALNCAFYSIPRDFSYCSGCIISGVLNSIPTACRNLCHFWSGTRLRKSVHKKFGFFFGLPKHEFPSNRNLKTEFVPVQWTIYIRKTPIWMLFRILWPCIMRIIRGFKFALWDKEKEYF